MGQGAMTLQGLRAFLAQSLTARLLAVAWISTVVFGLIFGLATRTVVTQELRRGLQTRAAALGDGLRANVGEAVALDDQIGLHLTLHDAVASSPAIRYLAVLDDRGGLVGSSFSRPPSTAFLRAIRRHGDMTEPILLRTEFGLLHDVVVPTGAALGPSIHIGVDEETVTDTTFTLSIAIALAGFASLVVGLLIAGAVTRWIALPLREVAAAADQIARAVSEPTGADRVHPGQGPASIIKSSSIAEVALLTTSFNRMSEALHDSRVGLAAAQLSLVHTERMAALGAFVAGTAHAINNPLGGLRACLEMMARRRDDDASHLRYAGIATQAVDRIDDLVRRLVRFVRSDGVGEVVVDLNQLVRQSLVVDTARDRDVSVRLVLCEGALLVTVDAAELEQALTNLVLNAIQASPSGAEVLVRTSLAESATAGPLAQLEVIDKGPGIPTELRQRVFEPFFTTKPEGEGTGLGLWIVWSVVQRHRGLVTIEGAEQGGTRFVLRLPRTPGQQPEGAEDG